MLGALARYVYREADTEQLLGSLDGILGCFSEGRWVHCTNAGKWPLFQYLPALPLRWLGMSLEGIGRVLSYFSLAAFVALLVVSWRTLAPRSRPVAVMAELVLCSGLFIHYSNRSFGEMVSAFLSAALAAAWLRRRGAGLVAVLAFLTSLTKETAFPFIGLIGVTCAAVHRAPGTSWLALLRAERNRLLGAALGTVLGLALFVAANFFRYGLPYNITYFQEASWGPSLAFQLENSVALWLAPNAGLLFFWPLLVLMLVALPVAVWKQRREGATVGWEPLGGLGVMIVLLTVFLARWWAPFGWWAWGSRLILPWMPAVLLVALYAYAEAAGSLIRPLVATRVRAGVLTLVLIAVTLPHVASIFRSNEIIHTAMTSRGECVTPNTPATHEPYYRCIRMLAWEGPFTLANAYSFVPHPQVRLRALLATLLAAVGGAWLWRVTRPSSARA
ncbi:hypothetical protein F0U61_30820 [Archangium violaceum]|uniref:hypothetical protein n=1 Tax=Archangium violaceum TaxID=83451 RepID=UPI002B2BD526|nr:hypothetical protein F0U61_30820 [Archangium violaceum]